ncbi:MAG: response regulator, partial [Armatimonadetes bacterium]|nr:response regulator [Armatimonadota bacterium]
MSKKILMVENNQILSRILKMNLEGEGFSVSIVSNGREALERIKAEAPDLIFLDIKMPDMDGFQVCRTLKEDDGCKNIAVIFFTNLTDPEIQEKCSKAGAVDCLIKTD